MDYSKVYCDLIESARNRVLAQRTERHHVIPKSLGGTETSDNIVELTVREHFIAHCLLFKMGLENQIFSVECFLIDNINPKHWRYKKIKPKRWIRQQVSKIRAKNNRAFKQEQARLRGN